MIYSKYFIKTFYKKLVDKLNTSFKQEIFKAKVQYFKLFGLNFLGIQ